MVGGLEVALPVECSGEGSVVQRPRWRPGVLVGRHPHDAVLSLVRGQFPPQLLHQDVGLGHREGTVR